ncbi:MAG: nucleotidyltransferase [bacterium]|nr:nucleotidyltransferase [bacterium]
MNIDDLREQNLIIFECISGSRSYGLATPASDTDIKGVYVLSKEQFYGLDYIPQVANETNDIVFYELRRFVELLYKNNPNILEMLNISPEHILYKHPLFDRFKPELFLSKECKDTYAGYAMTQLKKARGLKKKILNPMAEEKKSILDFCHVIKGQGSIPVLEWLASKNYGQEQCGLVNIPHMSNLYALFYDTGSGKNYQGIIRKQYSDEVVNSSVPKGEEPAAILYCNKNGYSSYCKDYKEYWEWVKKRNSERYKNTIEHGKNYDAKNIMHTFRLLDMAAEILKEGKVIVTRPNREELLAIKSGTYSYEHLIAEAEKKIELIEALFAESTLPEKADKDIAEKLLVSIRDEFYG